MSQSGLLASPECPALAQGIQRRLSVGPRGRSPYTVPSLKS